MKRTSRKSTRLRDWDYSKPGFYFVTAVTKNRATYFGRLEGEKVILSESGRVAEMCWLSIPDHFPIVKLHSFVIMPDHVHGIIQILENDFSRTNGITEKNPRSRQSEKAEKRVVATQSLLPPPDEKEEEDVATQNFVSQRTGKGKKSAEISKLASQPANRFGPQSENLASIVCGFKAGVKIWATTNSVDFAWQGRYHDRIIRDEPEFQRISTYIIENPLRHTLKQLTKRAC